MIAGGHLLSVLIFFPALGALTLLLLRNDDHAWIRKITFAISVAEFAFSLTLLFKVSIEQKSYQLEENFAWISYLCFTKSSGSLVSAEPSTRSAVRAASALTSSR